MVAMEWKPDGESPERLAIDLVIAGVLVDASQDLLFRVEAQILTRYPFPSRQALNAFLKFVISCALAACEA